MTKIKRFASVLFAVAGCQAVDSDGGSETGAAGPHEHGGEPGTWVSSPLDECGPPNGVPEVVVTEVFANGAAPAQGWVELHRPHGTEVALDGWTLAGLALPSGGGALTIPGYGYVVVCGADATVACDQPLAGLELGGSGTMTLEDAQDVVDQVAWSAAPGAGKSWQLRHPWLDNAMPGPAWIEAAGTPAERNAAVWQDVEAAECADALPCTLDLCDAGACAHPARPGCCSGPAQCNDNDPCTYDYCEANACTHASKGDACCDSDLDCVAKFFESECFVDRCVAGTCSHWFDASSCCKDDAFCEAAHEDGNDCTTERCVVIDPGTGRRECRNVIEPDCRTTCPYSEGFDAASSMALAGWAITDLGTPATSNWRFETSGDLGPDRFLKFGWNPTTPTVRSVAHGPKIDCHKADLSLPDGDWSNVLQTSTLQFRMRYRHSQGGGPVSIRAVVTEDGGQTWTPVAEWNDLTADLEYGIHSYPLPGTSWKGPALQVGFMVDTGSGSTFDMDSLLVDDVKVVPGVPNRFEKAVLLRCNPGASDCSDATRYAAVCDTQPLPGSSVPACVVAAGEALPEMSVGVCEWYKVLACFRDPDATYSTWNFFGFPAGWIEGAPLDPAPFVSSEGCFSDVGDFCPVTPNGFLCVFQVRPDCDESHAGTHRSGLVAVDEHDPARAPHSIFESLTKFTVNVLLESGWVIWSPLG
ncbi:MAG: lamin tail domain-containing protein, partial [Deltaproteobacteria bacterium]|nr:lamin tail domain-containing protein [Deltaproteobacteria bacterium]